MPKAYKGKTTSKGCGNLKGKAKQACLAAKKGKSKQGSNPGTKKGGLVNEYGRARTAWDNEMLMP